MNEISIGQIQEINEYWIVYLKANGASAHIQLSACANNFAIHHGDDDADGKKCVGVRYEKNGCLCYELFNVGHTLIRFPRKPGLAQSLKALLKGKTGADLLREQYEDFERRLNEFGWKTVQE